MKSSEIRKLDHKIVLPSTLSLKELSESGQVFGISQSNVLSDRWLIRSKDKVCKVYSSSNRPTLICDKSDVSYWEEYFQLKNLSFFRLDKSDIISYLDEALDNRKSYPVILKQDLWECLISFIISQRKSIPAIKSCISKLCMRYGKEVTYIRDDSHSYVVYGFPEPEDLKDVTAEELRGIGLGYRDKYILDAIDKWDSISKELAQTRDSKEHTRILKQIKGVGDKVASCVCLYALQDYNIIPIDTWIQRLIDDNLISISEIHNLYPDKEGIVQQVLFDYTIKHKSQVKERKFQ